MTNQAVPTIQENLSNAWQRTKETTTNAWDRMTSGESETFENKDAFLARTGAELDRLDAKIQEWSDKTATAAATPKTDAQAKLQDLRSQRGTLNQKYQAIKNSTEANWISVEAGFQDSYDNMTNSLQQAWQWLDNKIGS